MKAIILAAGVGRRLNQSRPVPKCLLRFGGQTLIQRHLEALAKAGVANVTVCVGYESNQVISELTRVTQPRVLTLHNPQYDRGSILSLWVARKTLLSGDDILLMDADVLYHPDILPALIENPFPTCLLLDQNFEQGDEPVKICLNDGLIVEFHKQIAPELQYNLVGESVGFFKFNAMTSLRLATLVAGYVANGRGDDPHEEALRDLILSHSNEVGIADITGKAWIEIDFPEDIQRAKEMILPQVDGY